MPFRIREMDAKSRRLMAIGNFSLAVGILLGQFVHPSSQSARNWLHGISGLLIGFSLATNFSVLLRSPRSCAEASKRLQG
jgi:hypothetical protein